MAGVTTNAAQHDEAVFVFGYILSRFHCARERDIHSAALDGGARSHTCADWIQAL